MRRTALGTGVTPMLAHHSACRPPSVVPVVVQYVKELCCSPFRAVGPPMGFAPMTSAVLAALSSLSYGGKGWCGQSFSTTFAMTLPTVMYSPQSMPDLMTACNSLTFFSSRCQ